MGLTVKPITPRRMNWSKIEANLQAATKATAKDIIKEFEKTTRTWNTKVAFVWDVKVKSAQTSAPIRVSASIIAHVYTKNKIWNWTDQGTKAHIIRPKRAPMLAFPSQFKPKTTPGQMSSGGGFSGPPIAFAKEVHHPGTAARNWTKMVAKKAERPWAKVMQNAMDRGAKQSGHSMP